MVRRLVGSFVKEGTSEGAYETLDEAEAFEAVRDRLISTSDVSFDVQQQCERLKMVAQQVLTAFQNEDTEGVNEGQGVEGSRSVLPFDAKRKVTTLHCIGECYRVQRLLFKQFELVMEKVPPQGSFTGVCRAWWPNGMGASGDTDASESDGSTSSTSTRTSIS